MHDFFWGSGMWIFPVVMMVGMLVMAFLICGRGIRSVWGHGGYRARPDVPREDPLEILKSLYAKGEIAKEDFERARKDLGGSAA